MTSTWSGMDPDAIRVLGEQLKRAGADLERVAGKVNTLTARGIEVWRGRDLERFRSSWSRLQADLRNAAEAVAELGQSAINNAAEQERASGGTGGSVGAGRVGPSSPSSTAGFLDQAWRGDTENNDGVRIQSGIGPDGRRKLIVYIDGTGGDTHGRLDWGDNIGAVGGRSEMGDYVMAKLAAYEGEGADILIIGYSQGGMVAEEVAFRSNFGSTTVITEAAPKAAGSHGATDVLRLSKPGLVNSGISSPAWIAEGIDRVAHPEHYEGDAGVDRSWNMPLDGTDLAAVVGGGLIGLAVKGAADHMNHDIYREVAGRFDQSDHPDDRRLQGKIAGFQNLALDYDSDKRGLNDTARITGQSDRGAVSAIHNQA